MKLWDLIMWNQRFRKTKNSKILLNILYVINKNLFFCLYIKEKYYRVFCINKKIFFSCVYIKEKYQVFCINKKIFFSGYNTRMLNS